MRACLRLLEKNFLSCTKQGKTNVYEAILSDDDYQKEESKYIIERLYHGSVKNFIVALNNGDYLSKGDLLELQKYIEEFIEKEK